LGANRGRQLTFEICVRRPDGQWTRFPPLVNTVADADIDRYVCYRLIKPIYIVRTDVGIYSGTSRPSTDRSWSAINRSGAEAVFQPSSGLYLMDLSTRRYTRLEMRLQARTPARITGNEFSTCPRKGRHSIPSTTNAG
jgi:hypothetical protein